MTKTFILQQFQEQLRKQTALSQEEWAQLIEKFIAILFPERLSENFVTEREFQLHLDELRRDLYNFIFEGLQNEEQALEKTERFLDALPALKQSLEQDLQALLDGDPAAESRYEVVVCYPGFYAVAFYRFAHTLYQLGISIIPRLLSEYAHNKTGIDIHPGASIGSYFFIDHGTGVVIGETSTIGDHVKIYQGVTLGALSVHKNLANIKRHPTIENNVVIYSGATILGGETTIGAYSIIGGNVWLIHSVPENSRVYNNHSPLIQNAKENLSIH